MYRNTANNIKFRYRPNIGEINGIIFQYLGHFGSTIFFFKNSGCSTHNFKWVSNTTSKFRENWRSNSNKMPEQTEERTDRPYCRRYNKKALYIIFVPFILSRQSSFNCDYGNREFEKCLIRTNLCTTLHETCPYSELFWSAFSHVRTEYGEIRSISPYLVRMRENADQNKSECGHFLRSAKLCYQLNLPSNKFYWKSCIEKSKNSFIIVLISTKFYGSTFTFNFSLISSNAGVQKMAKTHVKMLQQMILEL